MLRDAATATIDEPAVRAGLTNTVAHDAVRNAERCELLSLGQRRVLAALAEEPTERPAGAPFLARTALANPSSVRKALSALEHAELLLLIQRSLPVARP